MTPDFGGLLAYESATSKGQGAISGLAVMTETPLGGAVSLPGFHILVPVWGQAYCDLFTTISLPSQLAEHNLPSLPHKDRCLYHVLTRPEDQSRIEKSDAWRQLTSLMPTHIELWTDHERTPHDTMSACLRHGIERADRHDAASLFFNPDLVFADGAIDAMVKRVATGSRVIFTTGVRLRKETVTPEITRYRRAERITLAPRELAAVAMRNLHPISRQNFWTGESGTLLPATLFWSVGDDGFLARCFHLHPLLVWPERKNVFFAGTVDDDFVSMACPDAKTDHVVTDSDELLMCEISDTSRTSETPYRKGSIDDVVDWAESHTDARHRHLATFPVRFHATAATGPLWSAAEAESDRVIRDVLRRLDDGWLRVFLRSPTRLLRRWVRTAATASITQRNHPGASGWRGRIATRYLDFYRCYGAFCAGYERFRQRLDRFIFGAPDRPYPWSGRAFTVAQPVSATLNTVRDFKSRTLIVAQDADVRRHLMRAFERPTLFEWPHAGAASELERWPYADNAFDLVVCVGALQPGGTFLPELGRVTAPNSEVITVTPVPTNSSDRVSHNVPAGFKVEQQFATGGIGSTLALRLYRWSEVQCRIHRLSPVILEIPLLPFFLAFRFFAGCTVAIGARLADLFDRSGRFRTYDILVLTKRGQPAQAR